MAFTTSGNKVQGTKGVDVLATVPKNQDIIVYGAEEADVINLQSSTATILNNISVYGQDGADTITSAVGTQLVGGRTQGGKGNDNINYATINSGSIYGGADVDTISVGLAVNSTIQGSKGNDLMGTANGAEIALQNSAMYGGEGNDSIDAGRLVNSTVQGSKGNDDIDLEGNVQNSKVNGGEGNDTITIEDAVGEVFKGSTINGNKGADTIVSETGVTLDEVTIFGGSGNDTIHIHDSQTTISGDLGADILLSGAGDDVSVSGGEGNDTVTMEAGTAGFTGSVNGGAGNDAIAAAVGTTIMLGRSDSTAATAETGNGGAATAVADGDTFVFGDGVDVITSFSADDKLGAELATTAENISFFGFLATGAGAGNSVSKVNGANGTITWGDLATNGQTIVFNGLYAGGTFTIGDDAADNDALVIQTDGSGSLANASMTVVQGLNADGAADVMKGFIDATFFTSYEA